MASKDLLARVRFYANKNGLNLDDYTDKKILLRERDALNEGKTYEQFRAELLDEVNNQRGNFGISKCPQCGGMSLIHEDGCMHCKSCGWSACG